jgi:hypothetical protein
MWGGERERGKRKQGRDGESTISVGKLKKKRMLRDTRNPANPSVKKGKYLN